MKKIIALLSLSVLLSGCMYQVTSRGDIEAGATICAQRQATLVSITVSFDGTESVECSNRRQYWINDTSLTPIVAL